MRKRIFRSNTQIIAAVALGVFFVSSVLIMIDSLYATVQQKISDTFQDYSSVVIVDPRYEGDNDRALYDHLVNSNLATKINPGRDTIVRLERGGLSDVVSLRTADWLSGHILVEGKFPERSGEIAIAESTAIKFNLKLGADISFKADLSSSETKSATLVGIIADKEKGFIPKPEPVFYGTLATVNLLRENRPDVYQYILLKASNPAEVVDLIAQKHGDSPEFKVVSIGDFVLAKALETVPGKQYIPFIIAGVLASSFIILVLVIGSAFSVYVERDSRNYALERCLGVTRTQLFGKIISKAVTIGLCGALPSAVGAILIWFSAALLTRHFSFDFSVIKILLVVLFGVVVTVFAAVKPAYKIFKIPPVSAIRVSEYNSDVQALSFARGLMLTGAIALTVVACIGLAYLGGFFLVVAVAVVLLVLLIAAMPRILRFITNVAIKLCVAGQNPDFRDPLEQIRFAPRKAASIAALAFVIGAFITSIAAGAEFLENSLKNDQASRLGADLVVRHDAQSGDIDELHSLISGSEVVENVAKVKVYKANLLGDSVSAVRVDEDLLSVVGGSEHLAGIKTDSFIAGTICNGTGLSNGDETTVQIGGASFPLRAQLLDSAAEFMYFSKDLPIPGNTPAVVELWAKLKPGYSASEAHSKIAAAASGKNVSIRGNLIIGEQLEGYLSALKVSSWALLGVGIFIALAGISNTLRLSVIARKREFGLQRALGLTRQKVVYRVLFEALVSVLSGLVAGVLTGVFIGNVFMFSLAQSTSSLSFSSGLPLLFVATTIGAGALLTLLIAATSAREASRVSPVEALRTV
ncbi:ABC transporter permease [Canibacter sp. lx-72]|uniref:ABC transporter permease n=1 Tax=Canibacter zhuwentaonis TaxID=2837491 RepID=UPI001BDD5A49|nr:ABC transporter permease [Canibacter zhuwentaonis]MBT1018273.1 ABC transporter permease [Canibacter zhuwentaonis]MBT1035283.1 ABC transporter permease [Canibacter zhuwentaonis]